MKPKKELFEYCRLKARRWEPFRDDRLKNDEILWMSKERAKTLPARLETAPGDEVGIDLVLYADSLVERTLLSKESGAFLGAAIKGILDILLRAEQGDEMARDRIAAIDKVIFAEDYDYEKLVTVITKIAASYSTPLMLTHGRRIHQLMNHLQYHFEPVDPGKSQSSKKSKALRRGLQIRPRVHADKDMLDHWCDGDTVETLAIRMYASSHNLPRPKALEALAAADEWADLHPEAGESALYSIDTLTNRQSKRKPKTDEFIGKLVNAIIELWGDGLSAEEIEQEMVAAKLGIGKPGEKSAADALRKQMRSHGIKQRWPTFVLRVVDQYMRSQQSEKRH